MKIKLSNLVWGFVMIIVLIIVIIDFYFGVFVISAYSISWLSILISILSVVGVIKIPKRIPGFSLVLMMYFIFTQFGICLFVYAIPISVLEGTGYYESEWINDINFIKAVELGITALIVYALAVVWKQNSELGRRKLLSDVNWKALGSSDGLYYSGLTILIMSLLSLIYCIAAGLFKFPGNYINFRNFIDANVFFWGLIVMFTNIGIVFCFASGNRKNKNIFYIIFGFIALIILGTGNKGEILYPLLAVFGIYINKNAKIDKKIIITGLIILFVIIPTITIFRYDGLLKSNSSLFISLAGAFIEMGAQLRLSVFVINDVGFGSMGFLSGYSYITPFINIIDNIFPFISKLSIPQTYASWENFYKYGFSQVAESYANFGIYGVIIFHLLLGRLVSFFDLTNDLKKLCLYGAWVTIFIIMTRNRFSFVPGQMLLVYIIWKAAAFAASVRVNKIR